MTKHHKPIFRFLDIETSPILGFTWATYDTSVLKVIESSKIISVAWKDLHSDKTEVRCIADYENYKAGIIDDELLVKDAWKILDESDIICAHYGDAFDLKKLNARFAYYGLNSPTPYQTIDTKKSASKHFKFDSNSLNNLGAYLNVGQKINNGGFDLWVRCMDGDTEAWETMRSYNAQDVILLEQVYLKLRPFITNHPDLNAVNQTNSAEMSCASCLSNNLSKRGFSLTKIGRKQRFQCSDCGSWSVGAWQRNSKFEDANEDDS